MKICDYYSHRESLEIIKSKNILSEIEACINEVDIDFKRGNPSAIKNAVSDNFNRQGWADRINVKDSRLTINFLKSRIGVCLQIGNVARMYADILKLCYLFDVGLIDAGVLCVPHQYESSLLGANYARFDRLRNEIMLFQNIINSPLLLVCLSN